MNQIYNLINERERLINEVRLSRSSTSILSNAEKKRLNDITSESITRLANNRNSVVGQNFSGSGKIRNKRSETIVVEQRNVIVSYDYNGKIVRKDLSIAIQFQNESNFGSFFLGDKVFFSGKILKLHVDTNTQFGYSHSHYDIVIENISFQKDTKADGPCFIATAAYQDYDAPVVLELRKFRDTHLLNSYRGRNFINLYYRLSPPLANRIQKSAILRQFTKYTIVLPVYLVTKIFNKAK